MLQESLVVLDFETTGLKPEQGDRITEVGLVRIESGRIVDRYQSLANCDVRVPRFITAYTGISQQMVDDAPPVDQVMQQVIAFIGETPVVAHSASFDQRFFVRECRRLRLSMLIEPFLCSMRLARRVYPDFQSYGLGALAHALQLPSCGKAHRAAADAEVTAHLMLQMGQDLAQRQQGIQLTAKTLRRVMQLPVARMQAGLEKLCA
jgi:DNA polymerase III subunit epsilon